MLKAQHATVLVESPAPRGKRSAACCAARLLEKVRPFIRFLLRSQKIAQKCTPSTVAKATNRLAKVESLSEVHFLAQSAFFFWDVIGLPHIPAAVA